MTAESVLIDSRARYRLKLDPQLGAGNFLQFAYATNPRRNEYLVYTDQPFELPGLPSANRLSISDLKHVADRYAASYIERGIGPMDPVGVYCTDSIQYLVQFIALTAIGAIPVLTNGGMPGEIAATYLRRAGVTGIVADRLRLDTLAAQLRTDVPKCFLCLEEVHGGDPSILPSWYPYRHDHDSPVMITHSSGTTGVPKAVLLQHGRWFHGIRELLALPVAEGAERYLSALPPSHNASIAYAMYAILTGADLMLVCNRAAERAASAVEHFRPATVVSFPETYVGLAELDLDQFDLSSVSTWINSGDAAHETHIRRLVTHGHHRRGAERIAGSQFVDGLGSSELGHSSFRIIHTPYTNTYDRCVGIPQEWVDAAVFDPDGQPLPAGAIGRLGVKSPSVTSGYWNDSLLTCRSRIRGYWLTGDLAYRDQLGCYYHVDRISDAISTPQGTMYSLQTEEFILKHQQSLADCVVIGANDSGDNSGAEMPIVLAVPRANHRVNDRSLLDAVNAAQSAKGRPLLGRAYITDRSEIPVGVTGKVLKRELRKRFVRECVTASPA